MDILLLNQKKSLLKQYAFSLKNILGTISKEIRISNNDIEIKTTPNNLRSLISFLKRHTLCQYKQLAEITCSDVPGKTHRFTINYLLHSLLYNSRVIVTIKTNEIIPLPSITGLYESAG